ncbi:hypothetical protein [Endozoicomonas acroporae]|uniref:hypothetical protein n=1 Tax=Endozoicomonas acroporae TaxID=1701104 RepID=UPI003D78F6D1
MPIGWAEKECSDQNLIRGLTHSVSISAVKAHAGKVLDNLISHCLNPSKKPGPCCRVFFFYPSKLNHYKKGASCFTFPLRPGDICRLLTMANHSKYKPEMCDQVKELMSTGLSRMATATEMGIS